MPQAHPPQGPSSGPHRTSPLKRQLGLLGLAGALGLVGCQNQALRPTARPSLSGPTSQGPEPSPAPSASPSVPPAQGEAQASGAPQLNAPPLKLALPGRLGLALPRSLVGEGGAARLSGAGGGVAKENSAWVVRNDGRIVSNNSGAIVSNNSGAIIGNNSGALISDHGGALIGNNGSARRLLAEADLPATIPIQGYQSARTYLWVAMALVDLDDQLLEAFLQAEPRLGEWKRFSPKQLKYLPPPDAPADFKQGLDLAEAVVRDLPFAGLLVQEADGSSRLRLVLLPDAKAPLADGRVLIDLVSKDGQDAVMRSRFLPALEAFMGLASSSARVEVGRNAFGRTLNCSLSERFAPPAERTPLGAVLTGGLDQQSTRSRVRLEPTGPQQAQARMAGSLLTRATGQLSVISTFHMVGFSPAAFTDIGLALLSRDRSGSPSSLPPFSWLHPILGGSPGSGPPVPYYSPQDGVFARDASPELKALLPSFQPSDDAFVPAAAALGEALTENEQESPEALNEAVLALPESP